MLNKARVWFGQIEPLRFAAYLALVAFVFFLFFWNLSSLTSGLAPSEVAERTASHGLHLIYSNPVNAPHKLLQYALVKFFPNNVASLRLASAIAAIIFSFCFYKLSANWYGKLIGGFGTLIFISLPLFVVSARQASSEIMLFSTVVLLWLYVWFVKTSKSKALAWWVLAISSALLLYTPGIIWFMAFALFICRKKLTEAFFDLDITARLAGLVISAALLVPLIISGIYHPSAIKSLLLIPANFEPVVSIFKNTLWGVSAIFIKAPENQLIMGFQPVLSLVAVALVIFGVYAMQAAARHKAVWLALMILLGVLAAGLNNNVSYLALGLPALGMFIAAGLRYLYIEWRAIFPRNPVPKTFALILIAGVVATQVYYGTRYALIAWPHSATTKTIYVVK